MQTRDHALLGRYLLENCDTKPDPICRKLFLLGCIEPDWNWLTYTRGSIKYQFFHGHNAENAKTHLVHLTEKLLKSGVCTPLQWFRFGAALHYLADRFTFAHNRCFAGSLREHRLYEKLLHDVFLNHLHKWEMDGDSAGTFMHERYLSEQRSYQTDCQYIIGASVTFLRRLSFQARADNGSVLTGVQNLYGKV